MTRIEGLEGMREAPPLNITAAVEAARVAAKPQPAPEPVYTGPREGSAAWQAEQIATGKIEIPTRPVSLAFAQGAFTLGPTKKNGWSAAFREVWQHLRVARWIAVLVVAAFAAWAYFMGGAPSAREVSKAFVEVPGYQYQEAGGSESTHAAASLSSLPRLERKVSTIETRAVMRDGFVVAGALVAGLDPSESTDAKLSAEIDRNVPTAHLVVLGRGAGKIVGYESVVGAAVQVVFADEDGYLIAVAGTNRSDVHRIATAIGVANL